MPRFNVGDIVELNGLLGELHGVPYATVVGVMRNKDGITGLDEYAIAFEDSTQLRVWSFQLTGVVKDVGKRVVKTTNRHVTPHRAWAYLNVHGQMSMAEHHHVLQCERCLQLFQLCLKSEHFGDVLKQFRRKGTKPVYEERRSPRVKAILN